LKSLSKQHAAQLSIAKIQQPHGIRGGLKVTLFDPDSKILKVGASITVGPSSASTTTHKITKIQFTPKGAILYIDACTDRNQAELLRGQQLWVSTATLPELTTGEYYHFQLVGLSVLDSHLRPIGKVIGIEDNVGADNLLIKMEKQQVLVPLIHDAIAAIDLDKGTIRLTDMEGLLENGF
jgi:16S rRNA processing protein RimM